MVIARGVIVSRLPLEAVLPRTVFCSRVRVAVFFCSEVSTAIMSRATVSRGSAYSAVRTVFCSRSLSAAGGDAGRDPGVAGGASASASPAATDAVDSTDGGRAAAAGAAAAAAAAATGEAGLGRVGDPTGAGVGGASPGAVGSRLMASMLSPT
eukprot:scaffold69829_cov69-Phaeocystis_antarctica.AAC.4